MLKIYISSIISDLFFGDPLSFPHPVKAIGRLISFLNKILLKDRSSPHKEIIKGTLLVVLTLISIWGTVSLILNISKNTFFYYVVNIYLLYAALSLKSLKDAAMKVYCALKEKNIKLARLYLSHIVGRDTENLSEEEIVRGTIETVAEGFADGVVSPLFYFLIGGNPLAWIYKGVNTLDSMVGYKFSPYTFYGKTSAKLDDIFNFIPSRISAFLMLFFALISRKDVKNGFYIFKRDRKNHPSPNGGNPESAMAGILGVRLGGINYYKGHKSIREFIGDNKRSLEKELIKEAIYIVYGASFILFVLGGLFLWIKDTY